MEKGTLERGTTGNDPPVVLKSAGDHATTAAAAAAAAESSAAATDETCAAAEKHQTPQDASTKPESRVTNEESAARPSNDRSTTADASPVNSPLDAETKPESTAAGSPSPAAAATSSAAAPGRSTSADTKQDTQSVASAAAASAVPLKSSEPVMTATTTVVATTGTTANTLPSRPLPPTTAPKSVPSSTTAASTVSSPSATTTTAPPPPHPNPEEAVKNMVHHVLTLLETRGPLTMAQLEYNLPLLFLPQNSLSRSLGGTAMTTPNHAPGGHSSTNEEHAERSSGNQLGGGNQRDASSDHVINPSTADSSASVENHGPTTSSSTESSSSSSVYQKLVPGNVVPDIVELLAALGVVQQEDLPSSDFTHTEAAEAEADTPSSIHARPPFYCVAGGRPRRFVVTPTDVMTEIARAHAEIEASLQRQEMLRRALDPATSDRQAAQILERIAVQHPQAVADDPVYITALRNMHVDVVAVLGKHGQVLEGGSPSGVGASSTTMNGLGANKRSRDPTDHSAAATKKKRRRVVVVKTPVAASTPVGSAAHAPGDARQAPAGAPTAGAVGSVASTMTGSTASIVPKSDPATPLASKTDIQSSTSTTAAHGGTSIIVAPSTARGMGVTPAPSTDQQANTEQPPKDPIVDVPPPSTDPNPTKVQTSSDDPPLKDNRSEQSSH